MNYIPKIGWYLNDPVLIVEEDICHLFYIQAPQEYPINTYKERSFGHAISGDLIHWKALPDVLTVGSPGEWDDLAIWTMGFIKKDDVYYMFYTGLSSKEQGHIQRLGIATSKDLIKWRKHPDNPIINPDPRWYENEDNMPLGNVRCSDPHLYWDYPWYYVFYCARDNWGEILKRGCIGLARSDDLLHWQHLPPAYRSLKYKYCEVPRIFRHSRFYYIVYGTNYPQRAIRYVMSRNLLKDYYQPDNELLLEDWVYSLFPVYWKNEWVALFQNYGRIGKNDNGSVVRNCLSIPFKIDFDNSGHIHLRLWKEINHVYKKRKDLTGTLKPADNKVKINWYRNTSYKLASHDFSNGILILDFELQTEGVIGLLLRFDPSSSQGYAVVLDKQLITFLNIPDSIPVASRPIRWLDKKLYQLVVIAREEYFDLLVNNELMMSIPHYRNKSGKVGVVTESEFDKIVSLTVWEEEK